MPIAASLVQTPEISGSPHGILDAVYSFAGVAAFAVGAGALCAWRAADARRQPVANIPARTGKGFFIGTLRFKRFKRFEGFKRFKVLRFPFSVLRCAFYARRSYSTIA
jgi:hypothetical protein